MSDEGCYSDTSSNYPVIFYDIPSPPSTSSLNLCESAASAQLTASVTNNNILIWYTTDENNGTASTTAPIPNTTIDGVFNFYVSQRNNLAGCESTRSKITVTINSLPPTLVVKDTSYCNNANADTLKLKPITGNTLLWYGTNLTGGVGSNIAIKPSTAIVGITNYYVSQKDSISGCESKRAKIIVTINPIPSSPILSRDTSNYLVSNSAIGNTWYKDGTLISDTSQKFKPTVPGSYTVKTTQNGCVSSLSTPYYYLVTDIINLSANEFIKLTPNPFINQLNFDFVVKGYQRLNLEVFDIATGTKVASQPNLTAVTKITLGQLSAGTYVIKVTSNDNKIAYQFKMVKL